MSRRVIVAFDFSLTATGAIALDDTGLCLARETIKTDTSMPARQRLTMVSDKAVEFVQRYDPMVVMKEAPAYGASWAVTTIGKVHGAVDYAMEKARQPIPIEVSPSTLKKFATGRGVGEKGDIKMWVLSTWGIKFSDNNQADAYVLARIGGLYAGFFPMTSRHEGECLKVILSGNDLKDEAKKVKLIKKDMRVCACGKKMKTGTEMESGKCADCLRGGQNGQA